MISLPYNAPPMSQMMGTQNVPVQTSLNNFQPFQQPQNNGQQMQNNPPFPMNPQDPYKSPFYQLHQADVFMTNQYNPNMSQPRPYAPFNNVPPPLQTQPSYGPLLQNILEQIRGQASSTAPIFILPGGCQQSTNHHQQAGTPGQGGGPQATGQPTSLNYPSSVHCPPPFYPYPIPLPIYEPYDGLCRNKESSRGCGCCHRRQESADLKLNCCCNPNEQECHRCTATNDDTICAKRNCPASLSLQALASQLLSLSGIVSCAATRLILRKVPGSNITNTMEDTMDKAQRAIGMLNKEQLLMESRNAQQVNALINLHMTTNPPANIIPLLTLLQLKVNVMKAQIESLINKKVMECQGFGFEVETSGPIDPTVLTMKTNEELRHLLSALRQKECDERVNVNFSPYHSQRVIAECRLNNVQAKIRQVEAEFDRRRSVSLPVPSLTSRVIQQFTGSSCAFGFAQTRLFEPFESPDPFTIPPRNLKRLNLKPYTREAETTQQTDECKATNTTKNCPRGCKDTGTGEGNVVCSKEQSVAAQISDDSCSCSSISSEDSVDEDKKKLRLKVDRAGKVTISSAAKLENASLAILNPNVLVKEGHGCSCRIGPKIQEVDEESRDNQLEFVAEKQLAIKYKDEEELEEFPEAGTEIESEVRSVSIEQEDQVTNTVMYIMPKEKAVTVPSNTKFVTERHIRIFNEDSGMPNYFKVTKSPKQEVPTGSNEVTTTVHVGSKPTKMKTQVIVELRDKKLPLAKVAKPTEAKDDSKDKKTENEEGTEEKRFFGITLKKTPRPKEHTENERKKLMFETTGSEAEGQNSSEEKKTFFGVTLRKTDKSKALWKDKQEEANSTNEKQNDVNVSMVTHLEYDRGFGDLGEWTDINKCIRTKEPQLIDHEESNKGNHVKMFPKVHQIGDEKYVNGMTRFPPLKHIRTPENVFQPGEIESDASNAICDRGIPYHLQSKAENSIVSSIYSAIENQLTSFGSRLINILNLQNVTSSLTYNKSPSRHNISKEEAIFDAKNSKKSFRQEEDWTLLTWNTNDCGNEATSGEGSIQLHKMKQSIIVNKENNKFVLIGGSINGQSRELSRNGLHRPYHTRRTLFIKSRLKNPERSRQQPEPLFRVLKQSKNDKAFLSPKASQVKDELKIDNKNSNNSTKMNKNCSVPSLDRSFNP